MTRSEIRHASSVALDGRGLLITGAAGSGKSTLALTLMAFGAELIADDRTRLTQVDQGIELSCGPNIAGLIEARGVGLLTADAAKSALLVGVVDLDVTEKERLPTFKDVTLLGQNVPLFYAIKAPIFAPALMQFLRSGRHKA